MPSKNSIVRAIRMPLADVRRVEQCMEKYGVTFNKAVHILINKDNGCDEQMSLADFIDCSGEKVDDHGIKRAEFECMKRDAARVLGNKCRRCGSEDDIVIHHIKPLGRGGTNDISNLVPLCRECHAKIHGYHDVSFKEDDGVNREMKKLQDKNKSLEKKVAALKRVIATMCED